jgi:hypothetical protein
MQATPITTFPFWLKSMYWYSPFDPLTGIIEKPLSEEKSRKPAMLAATARTAIAMTAALLFALFGLCPPFKGFPHLAQKLSFSAASFPHLLQNSISNSFGVKNFAKRRFYEKKSEKC